MIPEMHCYVLLMISILNKPLWTTNYERKFLLNCFFFLHIILWKFSLQSHGLLSTVVHILGHAHFWNVAFSGCLQGIAIYANQQQPKTTVGNSLPKICPLDHTPKKKAALEDYP